LVAGLRTLFFVKERISLYGNCFPYNEYISFSAFVNLDEGFFYLFFALHARPVPTSRGTSLIYFILGSLSTYIIILFEIGPAPGAARPPESFYLTLIQ